MCTHTSLCIVDDLKGPLKIERPLLITLFFFQCIHEICCYLALEKPRGNQFFGTTLLWLMMGRPKQRYLTYMYVCLFFATEFQYKQVRISKDIYYYSVDFDRSCSETLVFLKTTGHISQIKYTRLYNNIELRTNRTGL